jgi:fatty-acyl-CoA synthase
MFITGGENIFPPEIEAEIYKHPSIHEVCVVGVPDKKWGEVGKAVITLKQGKNIDTKELKEFLNGKIGSIKIPKYVQVIEEIPKNNTGKIQRGTITRLYG